MEFAGRGRSDYNIESARNRLGTVVSVRWGKFQCSKTVHSKPVLWRFNVENLSLSTKKLSGEERERERESPENLFARGT